MACFLRKKCKGHEDHEALFQKYLTKAKSLLQEQYEKHIQDPQAQPWVAISHIRDKIIPAADQYVFFCCC